MMLFHPDPRALAWGGFVVAAVGVSLGLLLLESPSKPALVEAGSVPVIDLETGETTTLLLNGYRSNILVVTTRCAPILRYLRDLTEMLGTMRGAKALLAPSVREAEFFLQFEPTLRAYATVDENSFEVLGLSSFPSVLMTTTGGPPRVLSGIPSRRQIHLARWMPFSQWRGLQEVGDPGCTIGTFRRMGEVLLPQGGS
jgi:hypothetical protein